MIFVSAIARRDDAHSHFKGRAADLPTALKRHVLGQFAHRTRCRGDGAHTPRTCAHTVKV